MQDLSAWCMQDMWTEAMHLNTFMSHVVWLCKTSSFPATVLVGQQVIARVLYTVATILYNVTAEETVASSASGAFVFTSQHSWRLNCCTVQLITLFISWCWSLLYSLINEYCMSLFLYSLGTTVNILLEAWFVSPQQAVKEDMAFWRMRHGCTRRCSIQSTSTKTDCHVSVDWGLGVMDWQEMSNLHLKRVEMMGLTPGRKLQGRIWSIYGYKVTGSCVTPATAICSCMNTTSANISCATVNTIFIDVHPCH